MVYKFGNVKDLETLPPIDSETYGVLFEFTSVLTSEYGEERDIDNDDGGYVLYAVPGTEAEEIKAIFDYTSHTIEYVNRTLQAEPPLCSALYLLHNEFAVVIVMSIADAPKEITDNFEEGY